MKIGIIAATDEELNEILKIMNNIKENHVFNLFFYEGDLYNKEIIVVKSGIGKVNAARTTQILIDKYNVEKVINIGAAGGINPELNIKDIVIGDKLVQYDFDASEDSKYKKGEITGIGRFIESDKELVLKCKEILEKKENRNFKIKVGTIATADLFCTDLEKAKQIRDEFGAECVEMEGAAIAQACYLDNIPFLVIRGISDSPNGNNFMDYEKYCEIAAKQATQLLKNLIQTI